VIAAYEEAHPAQGGIEIITPADFYDTAWATDAAGATDPGTALDRDLDLTPALDLMSFDDQNR